MSIFAIADPHLSFSENIEKPMDIFGNKWKGHIEKLQKNWQKTVSEKDTVIVAGDISWAMKLADALPDLDFLAALPGRKIMIKGNHDLWWSGINRLNGMYENIDFLQNSHFEAEGKAICGSRGWTCPGVVEDFTAEDEKIYRRELLRLEMSLQSAADKGVKDILGAIHFPPTNDKFERSGFTDLFAGYKVKTVVYGHLHGVRKGFEGEIDGVSYKMVTVDYTDCMPVKLI